MSMLILSSGLTYAWRKGLSSLPNHSDIYKYLTNEKALFVDFVGDRENPNDL